jgi:hypothetical protein
MKIENRQQVLVVVALAILALFAADKLLVTPLTHLWAARARDIASLRAQVAEGTSLSRRAESIRSRWTQMQTNTLPRNPSQAQEQVLKALVNWSQESGISLNGITPQWKNDSDDYQTLVCRVDASGTLWAVSRFLYDIEVGPMALKVESVDLGSRDNSGQQLTLGLQVSGLVLIPKAK